MMVKKTVIMQNPGYSLKPRRNITNLACNPFTELEESMFFNVYRMRSFKTFFKLLL